MTTLQDNTVERRKTITVFRPELLRQRCDDNMNVIACGAIRGGTSAMGITLRNFGFFMGDNVHEYTHEDIDFIEAVQTENVDVITDLIRRRNAQHPGWCLKLPSALTLLEIFDEHCAAPVFLIITRNQFSIASSLVRRDERFSGGTINDYVAAYEHAYLYLSQIQILGNIRAPAIICEYENVLENPELFVKELSLALNLQLDGDVLARTVALIGEKEYKTIDGNIATEEAPPESPTPSWHSRLKKLVLGNE